MKQKDIDKEIHIIEVVSHRLSIRNGLARAAMYIADGTIKKETILAMLENEIAWFETEEAE